jgi:hypothetical protein
LSIAVVDCLSSSSLAFSASHTRFSERAIM